MFAPTWVRPRMQEFRTLPRAFVTMAAWLAGDPNLTLLYSRATHPVAACLLGLSFVGLLQLVFMRLLVGIMSSTLDKVR